MQERLLVALSALLIACGSGATDVSTEVSVAGSASITAPRPTTTDTPPSSTTTTTEAATTSTRAITSASPTTTIPPTTTTRAPTTTTTQALTTTVPTTTTLTTTTAPAPSATATITASNFAFAPASVTINRGDTVQWVLGSGSHTTTSGISPTPDGGWDQTITAPVTIVFSQPGQFSFFCRFHPTMQGTIVVP